ncbi:MAG: hypothetical protein F4Z31_03355 [Gemmatimonadetes bacterium]|nr:hypothetical protein [Gemmatimonadota bacterium]MYE94852.1 hypothetical protein [Gemmatimonadota bacterium]MYJ10072.1 hypothetical protein [Gemmatimonadota bacterium]
MTVSPKPPLLALLGSPRLRDRVRVAVRLGASSTVVGRLALASNWRQLWHLAEQHPGSPAVIDTLPEGPGSSKGGFGYTSADDRSFIPIISYAAFGDWATERKLDQGSIAVEAHMVPGVSDDFDAIDTAILGSIDAQHVYRLRERVGRTADPRAVELLECALEFAFGPCTVADFAVRVGLNERALQRLCAALGIPSPRRLLSLARIYTVQRLSDWSRQPFGTVACALGFSASSNYRRLVRGLLQHPPAAIQQLGGGDYMAKVIVERVG